MSELIRPGTKGARWDIPRGVRLLVCRVTPGNGWWDIDDQLDRICGREGVIAPGAHRWHALPEGSLPALELIAESNPGRLVVHRAFRRTNQR